ncbi:RNA-binding protein 43-like isoform X2 [Lissotriton helveticus]
MAAGSSVENVIAAIRTVSVHGIPSGVLEDEVIQDLLTIHFQKVKNGGGDVEKVTYPTTAKGVAFVTFEDVKVAENVLQKDGHILTDRRLPNSVPLKVVRYGEHVFTFASAILDLSLFCEQWLLEDLVEELKKNVPDLFFSSLTSDGKVTVEGSFPAIRQLREFLVHINSVAEKGRAHLPSRVGESSEAIPTASTTQELKLRLDSSLSFREENNIESSSLFLDTDVCLFMTDICRKDFDKCLNTYSVVCDMTKDADITMLRLKPVGAGTDPRQVEYAKMDIQILYQSLQPLLRKERIYLDDKQNESHIIDECNTLKHQFSEVLVIPCGIYIDVIGRASDISFFMQALTERSLYKGQDMPLNRTRR